MKFNAILKLTKGGREQPVLVELPRQKIPLQSPLTPRIPIMTIESDASNMGWGARQGEQQTGGRWFKEEDLHHINYMELLAAFLALQCFAKHMHSVTI